MKYVIVGIVVLILVIIISIISMINKINRTLVKIDEADSGIDVALAKRYDVLTKMIEVVKAYSKYEKETIFEVINLRNKMNIQEKIIVNNKMNENFNRINAISENYPELKASENYKILQQSVLDVEEHLQAARRLYNSNVSLYNQLIVSIPTCIIAKVKKLQKKDFFEADEEANESIRIK